MKLFNYIKNNQWVKSIINLHLTTNESINLPYHNLYHTLVVSNSVLEACQFYNISKEETDASVCAGLFHDFNHSGGKQTDTWNVNTAIEAYNKWNSQTNKFKDNLVESLILSTKYPYEKEQSELTLLECIMRDADMSQLLQTNRIQQNYLGVGKEFGLNARQSIEGTIKFIQTVVPNTVWFKMKWDSEKPIIEEELNLLLDCYTNL